MTRRRQPHRVPPPITFGSERLDGVAILEENAGPGSLDLWRLARRVHLIAMLPPQDRERFVGSSFELPLQSLQTAQMPREVSAALIALVEDGAAPDSLVEVARAVAKWADDLGRLGTAVEFMQAAALLRPEDPELANAVARLCRRRGDHPRAESWYRQGLWSARQRRDWRASARSHLGFGTLHIIRGNHPAARKAFMRGLRAAKRGGGRDLISAAYHELTVWAIRVQKPAEVSRFASFALQAYGPHHPRLPALAHDLGLMWMKQGYFREALEVFQTIPREFGELVDQLARAACQTRAASGIGDRHTYEAAWVDTLALIRSSSTVQSHASVYLDLAHAARNVNEYERARWAGELSLELAEARGETKVSVEAEGLLDSLAQPASDDAKGDSVKSADARTARLREDYLAAVTAAGA